MKYSFLLLAVALLVCEARAEKCVDLSGTWEGICQQKPGQPFKYKTVIGQIGCEKKIEENIQGPIGTLNLRSTIDDRSDAISTQNQWSADGQKLIWTSVAASYSKSKGSRSSNQSFGTYSIENQQFRIISNERTTRIVDEQFVTTTVEYDCTLDRVPSTFNTGKNANPKSPSMESVK